MPPLRICSEGVQEGCLYGCHGLTHRDMYNPQAGRRMAGVQVDIRLNKTTVKKLGLSRVTIGNLVAGDLEKVMGGIVSSDNQTCTYSRKCQQQTLDTQ